jgi:outer membrane protein OmpA-like peptidoglycan-associated protein
MKKKTFDYLLCLFLFAGIPSFAQVTAGFKALDEGQYELAQTAFAQALAEKENAIPARWGLVQCLAASDNPTHQYDSAFVLKQQVEKQLRSFSNKKLKKKWAKRYDLSAEFLKKMNRPIVENRWKELAGTSDLQALDQYIQLYQRVLPAKIKTASKEEQQSLLRKQANGGAADTYAEVAYLLQYHLDYLKKEFPGRIQLLQKDLLRLYEQEKGTSPEAIQSFLKRHPSHELSTHASRSAFESAIDQNKVAGYLLFLATTKDSPFDSYITGYLAELLLQNAVSEQEKAKLPQEQQWILEDLLAGEGQSARIQCGDGYEGKDWERWQRFIQRRAGSECGAQALRSVVNFQVDNGQWTQVVSSINQFAPLFPSDTSWLFPIQRLAAQPGDVPRPQRLGGNINTNNRGEYVPAISPDGRFLAFCGETRPDGIGGEDIYLSERKKEGWGEAQLVRALSTSGNEAPLCFTADGNTLVLFINGKIFTSERTLTGWASPQRFPIDFSQFYWVADVHFVPGEQRVFFAGKTKDRSTELVDIFTAAKKEDGTWEAPVRLPVPVNSGPINRSPFIHPDQRTLYFSSDRPGGFGDLDVYRSVRLDDTWLQWSEPVNLGKGINNAGNNWGYVVTTDGTTAYFAGPDEQQKDDLYSVALSEAQRPEYRVQTLVVEVRDEKGEPMPNAQVELRQSLTGQLLGQYRTPPGGGRVSVFLPEQEMITLSAIKKGYYGAPITLTESDRAEMTVIQLQTVKEVMAQKTNLNADILFDLGKSTLKPAAVAQIRFLAEFVQREGLKLTLVGHTDPSGSEESNILLSRDRAEAVEQALIAAGLDGEEIDSYGEGEAKPVCQENTPECYKKNRRVEITFIQR